MPFSRWHHFRSAGERHCWTPRCCYSAMGGCSRCSVPWEARSDSIQTRCRGHRGHAGLFYAQYFALFTIFGGSTPGMMLRGMRVVSFDGSVPTSRQMVWRSFGYLISAGTCFLGFLWALWDEDHLCWQDRISRTYLTPIDGITADAVPGARPLQRRIGKYALDNSARIPRDDSARHAILLKLFYK